MAKAKILIVSYIDGSEEEISAGPKAQVATERHFGHSLMAMDTVEEVYYLAWSALSLAGKYDKDFDTFLEILDDVDYPMSDEDKAKAERVMAARSVTPIRPGRP